MTRAKQSKEMNMSGVNNINTSNPSFQANQSSPPSAEAVFMMVSLVEFELSQLEGRRISDRNDDLKKIHDRKKKLIELQTTIKNAVASTRSPEGIDELTAGEIREIERQAKEAGVDLSAFLDPIKAQMVVDYNKTLEPKGLLQGTEAGAKWDWDGDGYIGPVDLEYDEWRRARDNGQPYADERFAATSFEQIPDGANHWLEFPDNNKLQTERQDRVKDALGTIDKSIDLLGDDQSVLTFELRKSFNAYSTRLEHANELVKMIHQVNEKLLG